MAVRHTMFTTPVSHTIGNATSSPGAPASKARSAATGSVDKAMARSELTPRCAATRAPRTEPTLKIV
jgi:hypothetical protein